MNVFEGRAVKVESRGQAFSRPAHPFGRLPSTGARPVGDLGLRVPTSRDADMCATGALRTLLTARAIAISIAFGFFLGVSHAQTLPTLAQPTPPPPPEAWDSPQATLQTFLQDMKASRTSEARKALDLSDVPFPVRDTEGDRHAALLASVLSRVHDLKVSGVPANPAGTTVTIPVKLKHGEEVGVLTLDKSRTGVWKFDSETVSTLPHLYRAMQDEPQDNGLGPFPDPEPDPSMLVRAVIPDFLLHSFLWFELWQWGGLLVLACAAYILSFIVRVLVRIILRLFLRRIEGGLTPGTEWSLRRSAGLLAAVGLWWTLYQYLGLEGTSYLLLVFLLKAYLFCSVAWAADAVFDLLLDTFRARASALVRRADDILIPIAKKFVRFIFVLLALLGFAASMSVNIEGLMAGLGIGGLVLALAGKDSVENIFGSLTIIFDMPFGIGDYIKMPGAEGTVEEINLRSTRIRTTQDTLITMPNSNLIKASVENYGARRARRFAATVPISYANDLSRLKTFCEKARTAVRGIEKVREEDAYVELNTMDSSSIGLTVQIFFTTEEYSEELQLREEAIAALLGAAAEAKVVLGVASWNASLPEPTQISEQPGEKA